MSAKASSRLLHPLHDGADAPSELVFTGGEGVVLTATDGRRYVDGLAGLWNVLAGYGRPELARAAAEQMARLAYCSSYSGYSNEPAEALAARLAGTAHPTLTHTFFASGGAEANESAFKTARWYWKQVGYPQKTVILSHRLGYHGVTLGAMSATGIPAYWPMFEPRAPDFEHIDPPYPYRMEPAAGVSPGEAAAAKLEARIRELGPERVAAFVAEPVMGVGGVIVPPDDYFPRVREICDRWGVLLIADEVITGFGRTGKWFGLHHWDTRPDLMSFAKGITSGYLPLGGVQVSETIAAAIQAVGPEQRWMHAYTYSAHPTCCAVALANLDILEGEGLTERAAARGRYLLERLQVLDRFECVGEVRGLGLMAAVEFVEDRATRKPLPIGEAVRRAAQARGLLLRCRANVIMLAPALVVTEAEIDGIVDTLAVSIETGVGCRV